MKFKVLADPRVQLDLQEAMDFLKSRRKGLELRFIADYKNCLRILGTNPFFDVRYNEIRCLPLQVFKYLIRFKVDEENKTVIVITVISTYRDPKTSWLQK
ncbi:MAG: hypothetical protein CFE24_01840 [Flavobacterium sp. BFFFF2]|nr:MAG: hypothetical protein CFE24_01840 [Flavobacterium sp. BFFFF2]